MLSVGGMRTFFHKFGNGCALAMLGVFALSLIIGFGSGQMGNRGIRNSTSNTSGDTVVATINGTQVTEADFREASALSQQQREAQQRPGAAPGSEYAAQQGEVMHGLIQTVVARQEAEKRKVHPLEADIDRAIDQERQHAAQRMGKPKLSDQEWESYLAVNRNMSVSELREQKAKDLIPLALFNSLKAEQKVTENEARNQNAQVHLTLVLLPYKEANAPVRAGKKTPPLTESQAQQKANELYAKVKAGADIAAVAKANTADEGGFSRAGDTGSIAEYSTRTPGQLSISLPLLYGSAFTEAIHKLEKGQMTDVVKISGLQKGYGFAKLLERRDNNPKDFDIKKAVTALTEQRAYEKLVELVNGLSKSAKVEFKDPDKKAYYDLFKIKSASEDSVQEMMKGKAATPPSPTETAAQQAVVDKEIEDMYKRHPDDVNTAIIIADNIKAHKMLEPGAQNRLIQLNEAILKTNEDQARRFELADEYREKKQYDKAKAQYDRIAKLLSYNTPYDLGSMKTTSEVHQKLEQGYRSINQSVDADKEKFAFDALQEKIKMENIKQLEAQRKNKAGTGISPSNGSITLPPSSSVTLPADGSGAQPPITITPSPGSGSPAAPAGDTNTSGGLMPSSNPAPLPSAPRSPAGAKSTPVPPGTKGTPLMPPAGTKR